VNLIKFIYKNKFIPYSLYFRDLRKEMYRKCLCSKGIHQRHKRFLFLHIRKTGGTSFNHGLSCFFNYSPKDTDKLLNIHTGNYFIKRSYIFMSGNLSLINKNQYHIATTHLPAHSINISKDTFTFTILRDPVKRFISHYNMLKRMITENDDHPCLEEEREYFDECIVKCAQKMPIRHRCAQLFCFSKELDISEGIQNLSEISMFDTLDNYSKSINLINQLFNWKLPALHERKGNPIFIQKEKILLLEDLLKDEIEFYHQSMKLRNRISARNDNSTRETRK
jgi:hypothetical protein